MTSQVHAAIEAVWHIEAPRLIGALVRIVRDVDVAEDLAQDALLAAIEQWPGSGVPDQPGAWLMAVAKRRAMDHFRRDDRRRRKHEAAARADAAREAGREDAVDAALDDPVGDDVLRLVFTCCHPVLSMEARVALTLRLLGGLTTEEIARAYLAPAPTIAQRIVRAKRTLAEARVPFEVPRGDALAAQIPAVLQVLYLIFNEGYAATAGEAWTRPDLCAEALRLGRVLAHLVPADSEVHGLVALMEVQSSRLRARTGPDGEPVLLLDQDRARWDHLLIRRGLAALRRAERTAGPRGLGSYALQAAIAACHARARTPDATDWRRIVALYDALAEVAPSPVVELNRAVALGMAFGPSAGLSAVEALADDPALQRYAALPAVRADLLLKLGRLAEARPAFERAAALTQNQRERALLLARAASCGSPGDPDGTT